MPICGSCGEDRPRAAFHSGRANRRDPPERCDRCEKQVVAAIKSRARSQPPDDSEHPMPRSALGRGSG